MPSNIHVINLNASTVLAKSLIVVTWLDPEWVSADGYITVLKIQTEIDGRWVKMESF